MHDHRHNESRDAENEKRAATVLRESVQQRTGDEPQVVSRSKPIGQRKHDTLPDRAERPQAGQSISAAT